VRIVKRREGSYWDKDMMNIVIADNGFGLGEGRELELQNLKFSTND
jgi:hypothetical protein